MPTLKSRRKSRRKSRLKSIRKSSRRKSIRKSVRKSSRRKSIRKSVRKSSRRKSIRKSSRRKSVRKSSRRKSVRKSVRSPVRFGVKSKKSKKCPDGKIENPATGRCVDANGKIGKSIAKKSSVKSSKKSSKKSKKCPDGKIENPASGRCVDAKGKLGKSIAGGAAVSKKSKTSVKSKAEKSKKSKKVRDTIVIECHRYIIATTTTFTNLSVLITAKQMSKIKYLTNLISLTLNRCVFIDTDLSFLKHLTKLKELMISGRFTTINPEVFKITTLNKLSIINSGIITLSAEIGNLVNLTELVIHTNNIVTIPDTIGNLTNLIKLDLYTNQIVTLPDTIGNLVSLKQLFIEKNKLQFIPDTIGNLLNLEWLYLSENDLMIIPHEIGNLTKLTRLIINNNKLVGIPRMPNLLNVVEFYAQDNAFDGDQDLIGKTDNEIFEIVFGRPKGGILQTFIGPEASPEYQSPYKIYMSQAFVKQTQYKPLPIDNDNLRILLEENPKPHVVYACPVGHLHSAGNCGVPTEVATCGIEECNLLVGGLAHMIVPGSYIAYHDGYQYAKIWYGNFPVFSYDQYKRIRSQANTARREIGEPDLPLLPPVVDTNIARRIVNADIVAQDVNAECGICMEPINRNDANAYFLPECGHLMHQDCVEGARGGNLAWINDRDGVPIPEDDLRARRCPVCNINFKFGNKRKNKK